MSAPVTYEDVAARIKSWMSRPGELVDVIMKRPSGVADRALIMQLFDDDYIPGLFWIRERVAGTAFLRDEIIRDYREWIRNIALANIRLLPAGWADGCNDDTDASLAESVVAVLELPWRGKTLAACHTNQQADALVWRIIKLLAFDEPDRELPTQRAFNEIGRSVVTPILDTLDGLDLDDMWRVAIDAGLIGAEVKERSLGTRMTTPGSLRRAIPLETGSGTVAPQTVFDELMRRKTKPLGIDFRHEYLMEVLSADGPRSVAWLTDDYIETAFDLKLMEGQMRAKADLSFTIIPRDGYYRQDASYGDVVELLTEEKAFADLAGLRETGRLHVCPAGPRTSCIDGRALSAEAATHLIEADVVVVKGARSYEMLQGLKKPTYFCLSGNHSFTESLTGLDMDLAQGILVRQDPGVLTYADFRARATRRARTSGGREYGIARMTASEYAAARRSASYRAHLMRFDGRVDDCNAWLVARADQLGSTFDQVTLGAPASGRRR